MKRFTILFAFALIVFATNAQYSKIPPSFTYQQTATERLQTVKKLDIPFKVDALKAEDDEAKGLGFPERIAKTIPVTFTPQNTGEWTTLPNRQRIWRLEIEAPGASAIALLYDEFIIPKGGKLYIYDTNLTEINVYTDTDNFKKAEYSTGFISGDKVRLEYAPSEINAAELPQIKVSGVAYAYKNVHVSIARKFKESYEINAENQIGNSAPCEINVNCEQGTDWYHQKNGVASTVQVLSGGIYLCSGTVINNTLNDKTPYFLMAYHCGGEATDAQFNQWQFYFNFEKTGCDENSPLADYHVMTGATKRVGLPMDGESDGLLLELNQPIPDEWGVFYNGWDRRNSATTGGAAIHHPKGDLKKISLYSVTPTSATVYMAGGETGADHAHWDLYFNRGIIEGGSSGSPLFNSDGRVTGTLTGSNQNLGCNNPFLDVVYGKMSWHWDQSPDPDHQMAQFLDPDHSGTEYIDGIYGSKSLVNFKASPTSIYASEEVTFTNRSFGDIDTYVWNFEGGEPSSCTGENPPAVTYMNEGTFKVELTGKKGDEIVGTFTIPIQVSIKQDFCRPGQPIAIGNGTSVSAFPLGAVYRHTLNATIYTAEELGLTKKGLITGLEWNSNTTLGVKRTIEIYLQETDRSIFETPSTWATETAQATLVYSGVISANTSGANTYPLTTPFVYSGEKHLKVLVHVNSEPGSSSNCIYTEGPANSSQQWISTISGQLYQNTSGKLSANRPDIKFNYYELCDAEMPTAKFDFSPSTVYEGDSVKFNDFSTGPVVRRKWNFPGGNPSTSTQPSPVVTYMNEGVYDVSLFAGNHLGTDSLILPGAVTVQARKPAPQFSSSHNGLIKHADSGPFFPPTDNASVKFENHSLHYPKSIAWTFEGGNPETSAEETPLVQYPAGENKYDVKLAVSNSAGTADTTLTGYVQTGGTAEIWNIQQGESPSSFISLWGMLAEKFTSLSGGEISRVKVYTVTEEQKVYDMTLTIYSDNRGLPGTAISPTVRIPGTDLVSNGYNTFKFEIPVVVPETFHIVIGAAELAYINSYYSVTCTPSRTNEYSTVSVFIDGLEYAGWYDIRWFGLSTSLNIVPEFTYTGSTLTSPDTYLKRSSDPKEEVVTFDLTGHAWTASTTEAWIQLGTTSGSAGDNGKGSLTFKVSENLKREVRTGTIHLNTGNIHTIRVTQAGSAPINVTAGLNEENTGIDVTWEHEMNPVKYNVYRNGQILATGLTEKSYTDTDISEYAANSTICYTVSAVYDGNPELESSESASACVIKTGIIRIKDAKGTLKVYPNPSPAGAKFYVVSGLNETELKEASIEVYNLLGALVHKQKATGKTTEMNLPQKGIYLLRLKGENARVVIN